MRLQKWAKLPKPLSFLLKGDGGLLKWASSIHFLSRRLTEKNNKPTRHQTLIEIRL